MITSYKLLPQLLAAALSFMLALSSAVASSTSPKVLLEDTTRQMITSLQEHKQQLKQNPSSIYGLVEDILLPHIDIIAASRWVLGKHWRRANKQQKLLFIREFRTLLLRFYSSALAEYLNTHDIDHNIITFLPLRVSENKKDVTVHSEVHGNNGKTIPVKYNMHLTKKGWKVYDVSVEGISMISTYRSSFANEIKQKGVDGLITSLAEKNEKLLSAKTVSAR